MDWQGNLVSQVDKVKPETARRLLVLTLVSITIAVGWIVSVSPVAKGAIAWAPGLAFGAFAAVFLVMATIQAMTFNQTAVDNQVTRLQVAVSSLREPKQPGYHVGCRIGRRRLECGLLEVVTPTRGLPDDVGSVRLYEVESRKAKQGRFHHAELYEALADAVKVQITRAAHQRTRVESIGLAVPGGVHPERGQFADAVHQVAFKANDKLSARLASEIQQACDPEVLELVFGTKSSDSLKSMIHLDNDARCAARWLITDRGPEWQNFACVFAGAGIGSGLVFDRRVFYGASFRAGEVGHVNMNLGQALSLNGTELQPRMCSCGDMGYHFESLASIGGLGQLAAVMGAAELETIRAAYNSEPDRARKLQASMLDQHDGDGIMILQVLDAMSEVTLGDLEIALGDLLARREISGYLARVAEQYGKLFSVGLAALLDALDVNDIALCGTIPELLQGNRDFIHALREGVARASITSRQPELTFGSIREWGWQGAAMLSRDPGYMERRFKK